MPAGPHPRGLSRGDFAPRSGRRRFLTTTLSAFLSSRNPRYTGCRSFPSSVHSVKRTCATRSGRTQCAVSLLLILAANGDCFVARALSSFDTRSSSRLIEPRARVADVDQCRACVVPEPRALSPELHPVIHPEQQRPEVLPRVSRLGPAADDELLLVVKLQLAPRRAAAARLVRRAAPSLTMSPSHPSSVARACSARPSSVDLLADADRARLRPARTIARGARGARRAAGRGDRPSPRAGDRTR